MGYNIIQYEKTLMVKKCIIVQKKKKNAKYAYNYIGKQN